MKRVVRALVALLAGVLVVTGCSTNPNTAAVVGENSFSVTEVEQFTTALSPYLASGGSANQATTFLVLAEIGRQVAAEQKLTFTAEQKEQAIATVGIPETMAADPAMQDFLDGYMTFALTISSLGQEAFLSAATTREVQINPRFGAWNPAELSITPGAGSLSSPAPKA